jgi:hypothetical protein
VDSSWVSVETDSYGARDGYAILSQSSFFYPILSGFPSPLCLVGRRESSDLIRQE